MYPSDRFANKSAMNTLRLTLRQLQIFVAVARSGTTTAASAEIALSQSATSSAVNELERLLSLRLFDRAGKRLLLNDNGRALLPRALALLDGAAGIELMVPRWQRPGAVAAHRRQHHHRQLCAAQAAGPFLSQRNRAMPVPGAQRS